MTYLASGKQMDLEVDVSNDVQVQTVIYKQTINKIQPK